MPSLFDQNTFYPALFRDLHQTKREVIIESPFITSRRNQLMHILAKLRRRGVSVVINTRDPNEHDVDYRRQALEVVGNMQDLGIQVLYTAGHHRKLVIIDRKMFMRVAWMFYRLATVVR